MARSAGTDVPTHRKFLAKRKSATRRQINSELHVQLAFFRQVIEGMGAGTWEWFPQTGEVRFSDRWAALVGYRLAELAPITIKTWQDLAHPDDLPRSDAALAEVFAGRKEIYQIDVRVKHKDGHWVWVRDTGLVTERDGNGQPLRMIGTHIDITELKEREARLERLNRTLITLRAADSAVLEATNLTDLAGKICAAVTSTGQYLLAWFGQAAFDPDKTVQILAAEGPARDYTEGLKVSWGEDALGQGPSGQSIRTGTPQISQHVASDKAFTPWQQRAASFGIKASISVPVMVGGRVFGCMAVYSVQEDAFGPDEVRLFEDLARDLAVGIASLQRHEGHVRALETIAGQARQMSGMLQETVAALTSTFEMRDPYTAGHERRVAGLAQAIAERMGIPEAQIQGIYLAGIVHDIGKIRVPAEILSKPTKLTAAEFALIKDHAAASEEILSKVSFPWPVAQMAGQHHERIDGTGYPRGLKGDEILPGAKVLAVADIVESMTSHRPYRAALGLDVALEEIRRLRGTGLDPAAVDACLDLARTGDLRSIINPPGQAPQG